MKWIQFTKFSSKERFAVLASQIEQVYDQSEGCGSCIVVKDGRGLLRNTHVSQNFDWVINQLNAEKPLLKTTEDITNSKVWVVGQYKGHDAWELQGVFTDKSKALNAVLSRNYFIGEVPLDLPLPDETVNWDCEYPKIEEREPENPENCGD